MPNTLYRQIAATLRRHENRSHATKDRFYHKYEGYKSLGIKSPVMKEIFKSYQKKLKALSSGQRLTLAKEFFRSGIEEELSIGNALLALHLRLGGNVSNSHLDDLSKKLMSWSTVDTFALEVVQPILEKEPKRLLPLLKRWNRSQKLWQQRTSVVVFTRRVGKSGRFTSEALKLCENLVHREEDLLRKAVGWALKDTMRGDKVRVLSYVGRLRKRGVSSTIILYAIRDLTFNERKKFLNAHSSR